MTECDILQCEFNNPLRIIPSQDAVQQQHTVGRHKAME